jgi:PAS domain S-box-containing protein
MSGEFLKQSLEDLYENAPCGYIFTFPDGAFARINQTFSAWTGYAGHELDTLRFQDLLTVPGRIFYENQYAPLLRMQGFVKEVAFDLRCRGGERLPVLINSTLRLDAAGEPELVASTIFDATARQEYERELRVERDRARQLATIVNAASDAIIRAGVDGTIQTWNRGAETLFGYSAAEIIGTSLWDILTAYPDDEARQTTLRALDGGAFNLDTTGITADGREIDISLGLMPHAGLLGELEAISAIIRDISQRRTLERLQQEFLAMTSHELRNPLTSIIGQAQLMKRRGAYSERAVDSIVDQTTRLGRLIDDLLLASLIEADRFDIRPEPIDLVTEVYAAAEQFASAVYPILVHAPDEQIIVNGDRHRLGQVFANLLTNAMKYSPQDRQVVVHVRPAETDVAVDIIDQGVGIPADVVPRLFDRFYRVERMARQASGLGLGLYITHRIVTAHDGRIDVQSVPGEGSTFTVTLPRHAHSSGSG